MITPILMPTWGLSMEEGSIVKWLVAEGAQVAPGAELVEIETTKIANVMEASDTGILRRIVAQPGETRACGDLIAVLADAEIADSEIDAFVAGFVRTAPEDTDAGPQAPEPVLLDLPMGAIRYLQQGADGSAVVFIHGFGGDLDSWMFNQPEIAARHRTYAIDLPGHGGSTKDLREGSLAELADAIEAALQKLGLDHWHLVGHSLGGAVALELATRQPQPCRSLTLIAAAGLGERINGDYIDSFIGAQRSRDIQRCLANLFADPKSATRDMAEAVAKYKRLDGVEDALRKIEQSCFSDGFQRIALHDRLAALSCPVLAVWGAQDAILSPATLASLPGAETHLVDQAGHMPQMEQPRDVNERLLAHVAKADQIKENGAA